MPRDLKADLERLGTLDGDGWLEWVHANADDGWTEAAWRALDAEAELATCEADREAAWRQRDALLADLAASDGHAAELRRQVDAFARRIADQSELLARAAERQHPLRVRLRQVAAPCRAWVVCLEKLGASLTVREMPEAARHRAETCARDLARFLGAELVAEDPDRAEPERA